LQGLCDGAAQKKAGVAFVKEGYWINIATGQYERITEHCDWMKIHNNARKIGLPEDVFRQIEDIPNDYSGPRREKILRLVMSAGFVRVRGHGRWIAIEFTAPTKDAMFACSPLLRQVCGPFTVLRFNNLETSESVGVTFQEFESRAK
jgi:hypothetical protein